MITRNVFVVHVKDKSSAVSNVITTSMPPTLGSVSAADSPLRGLHEHQCRALIPHSRFEVILTPAVTRAFVDVTNKEVALVLREVGKYLRVLI